MSRAVPGSASSSPVLENVQPRLATDLDLGDVRRRRSDHRARVESAGPAASNSSPRCEIRAARADVAGRAGIGIDNRDVCLTPDVFLDDDAVGACRDRRSGEDAHASPVATSSRSTCSGEGLADHSQRGGEGAEIGLAHRIAVHRRNIARAANRPGDDGRGKHAAVRLRQPRPSRSQAASRPSGRARSLRRSRSCAVPVARFAAALGVTSMPPITIVRSIAFSMSNRSGRRRRPRSAPPFRRR